MDFLVEQIINFGVSENTIVLILMLPLVATFITFCRQVIGIRGFGIYITLLLSFGFVAAKLKYGLIIFLVVFFTGTILRFLIRKIRILYLPRMAIILTGVTLVIFLMFFLGSYLEVKGLQIISIFPILVMMLVVERFVSAQIERGAKIAILMTFETFILAIISYFIIIFHPIQKFLLNFPIPILLALFLFNFFLGKWTGFRLTEYLRFKELRNYFKESTNK